MFKLIDARFNDNTARLKNIRRGYKRPLSGFDFADFGRK